MTQTATPKTNTWNSVTFTGNLGRDPEMNFTKNGTAVTKFSIAVSQGKDKPPMWLNVEVWKELAEACNEKLTKGSRVQVEGRMAQDKWERDGQTRYALKVVGHMVKPIKSSGTGKASTGFIEEDGDDNDLGDVDDHPF